MTDEIRESYRALELEEGASPEAVKEAYRSLVKVWHPDRFGDDEKLRRRADDKLKQINRAYETLKDYRPPREGREPVDRGTGKGTESDAGEGKRPAPRVAHVPHAKIQRAPNMLHARLGCLLVGGVSGVLLILILASLFYDEALSGRRTVTVTPQAGEAQEDAATGPTDSPPREGEPPADDEGRADAVVESGIIEANLTEAEERARQAAIAAAGELDAVPPVVMEEQADDRRSGSGDRSFLSQQFYKNGMAHLKSRAGPREDEKAAEWFRQAAGRGHAGAQRMLAGMLREGRGVRADADKALFWILVAAGLGDAAAARSITEFEAGLDPGRRETARALAAAEVSRLRE